MDTGSWKLMLAICMVAAALAFARSTWGKNLLSPEVAAERVARGEAVLVDVREPAEWKGGVVEGAVLLPLSDLEGDRVQWRAFLEENRGKELILYCRTGNRSGQAAAILREDGFKAENAGGLSHWKKAGQAVVSPPREATRK